MIRREPGHVGHGRRDGSYDEDGGGLCVEDDHEVGDVRRSTLPAARIETFSLP